MDSSMNNGYVPSIYSSEGIPLFYQNPNVEWCPEMPEIHGPDIRGQLGPYHAHCSPNVLETTVIPNLIHFPAPSGPSPQQEPQPEFCLTQRVLPQTCPYLPNLPPISLTPPVQPYLTPEPVIYSAFQQQPSDVSRAPFRFVNIEIPRGEYTHPYIVSIPVPVYEFIPVSSSPTMASQMTLPPSPCFPSLVSLWEHPHFIGEGRRKKPQVRSTRSSSQDSGSSRSNQREGENGLHFLEPCKLCQKNKETKSFCYSHTLRDINGKISCPVLRVHVCKLCGATGDNAHTFKYCPARQDLDRGGGGEPAKWN